MSSRDEWVRKLRGLVVMGAEEMGRRIPTMPDETLGANIALWSDAITSYGALVPSDDRDAPQGEPDRPSGGRRTAGARPKRASRKPGKRRPRAAAAPRVDPAG